MTDLAHIRNFSIVAHIDHGKSTLADRLIQSTGTVSDRDMKEQLLDAMDIERERGITIKANTVRIDYTANDGEKYVLNLIDTPGHVDFAYEVSRSMRACRGLAAGRRCLPGRRGADARQRLPGHRRRPRDRAGPQQDRPARRRARTGPHPDRGRDRHRRLRRGRDQSAKTGLGIPDVLEAIVTRLPAPKGDPDAPLKAMLVDSWYDAYLGVVVLVRIKDGHLKKGDRIRMMNTGAIYPVDRVGVFRPAMQPVDSLGPGEIGFLTASIKQVRDTRVGDTITTEKKGTDTALPGFKPSVPVVFCGLFPVDAADFEDLRDAIEKLQLNDASFSRRDGNLRRPRLRLPLRLPRPPPPRGCPRPARARIRSSTSSPPRPVGHLPHPHDRRQRAIELHNPADMPDLVKVDRIEEPRIKATILVPDDYLGDVLKLCQDRRGIQLDLTYAGQRAMVVYDLPLNEVVFDFYDRLKSVTKGYASFDYQMIGYSEDQLVKMQILVNDEPVDALSTMVHRTSGRGRGRADVREAQGPDPPAHVQDPDPGGGRRAHHRARDHFSAMRKDVTAKCYGGDVTRKKKLLEKQKAGKKRMRQFGKVDIPQEAFISALKMDD